MANAPCAKFTTPISPMVTDRPTEMMNRNIAQARPSNRILTMVLTTACLIRALAQYAFRPERSGKHIGIKPLRGATSHFEDFALVLHLREGLQDFHAELAVRFLDDFFGVLVLDDVARLRVDLDRPPHPLVLPAFQRIDHLGAVVEIAVQRVDDVKNAG